MEKAQEVGFFSNSYATIDLEVLKDEIESQAQMKVGLWYKSIYQGKIVAEVENKLIVRAIHMELEAENFNRNFKKIVSI